MIALRHRAAGRIAFAAMALGLLLRLLVPNGYMWMPDAASGLPRLTMCSGTGPIAPPAPMMMAGHVMAHAGMAHDHHQPAPADHRCPFAAIAAAPSLAEPLAILPLPFGPPARLIVRAAVDHARPGLGLAAPPPPKTGPPFLD